MAPTSALDTNEDGVKPGDHIKVALKLYGSLIEHHGICIEDGYVIHFYKSKLFTKPKICKTQYKDFKKGGEYVERVAYLEHEYLSSPEVVIDRAKSLINSPGFQYWDFNPVTFKMELAIITHEYNLVYNNCEHFATYCKTGRKISLQSDPVVIVARNVEVGVETTAPKIAQGVEIGARMAKFYPVASRAFGWMIPASKSILQALRYLR